MRYSIYTRMESECVYVSYSDIIIILVMTHSSRIVKRSSMAVNENVMQSLFLVTFCVFPPPQLPQQRQHQKQQQQMRNENARMPPIRVTTISPANQPTN